MKGKLVQLVRNKVALIFFLVNTVCLAYTISTRFTDILFAQRSEKLALFTVSVVLSAVINALMYLVIFRNCLRSVQPGKILVILAVAAFAAALLFVSFYELPPFPENHELTITAPGEKNPLSSNTRVEIVSVSTVSYPALKIRRIPNSQFTYDGDWGDISGNDFAVAIADERTGSISYKRFMQAGVKIEFQKSPAGGIANTMWDGKEITHDLYSENTEPLTLNFQPALDWKSADRTRKILVAGAAMADFIAAASALLVGFTALFFFFERRGDLRLISVGRFGAGIAIILCLLTVIQITNTPVNFSNSQIENAVREALDHPEGEIYSRQLLLIVDLDLSSREISSLDGIEQLRNLIRLNLQNNQINDIARLQNLTKLEYLNLEKNNFSDLAPLKSLTNLEYLNINSNESLRDFTPIESLVNLRKLSMGNLPISGEKLDFNALEDLEYLYLRNCQLSDINFISSLSNLKYLNLHSNADIQSIEPLKNLIKLEKLILANVSIQDQMIFLADLGQLKYLNLRNTRISNISVLANMPNLEYLNLHSNAKIGSITPIKDLSKLEHLILRNVPINDERDVLSGFSNLQTLNIRNTGTTGLEFLKYLMERGALQDNIKFDIAASLDIRDNPIQRTAGDDFADVRPYWQNITFAEPKMLVYYAELFSPGFSNPSGFYEEGFLLSLSNANPDGAIYYTLDGSEPTTQSEIYTQPVSIEDITGAPNIASAIETITAAWDKPLSSVQKAVVVRAKIINDKTNSASPTVTHTYFVGSSLMDHYSFPVISLVTDFSNFFDEENGIYVLGKDYAEIADADLTTDEKQKYANFENRGEEWERPIHIEVLDRENLSNFAQDGGVRIHGGGSRRSPQKSLRIYADCAYDVNCLFHFPFFQENTITGSGAENPQYESILLRNFGQDWMIGMMRDALAFDILQETELDGQAQQPVIVFLNGEYWGIYQLQERYDEYYLLNHYGISIDEATILRQNGGFFRGNPGGARHYAEMIKFIKSHDLADDENYAYLQTQIDIDSYIDYLIANIFLGNTDWPENNIYMWRKSLDAYDPAAAYGQDGRWRWMIFDMDFILGLQGYGQGYAHNTLELAQKEGWGGDLLRASLDNASFRNAFINRFADQMNTTYMPERIVSFIDEKERSLAPEMEEFFERWGGKKEGLQEKWQAEIADMRAFAENRPAYIRQFIIDQFNLNGSAELIVHIDEGKGSVIVNSLEIGNSAGDAALFTWRGNYFDGVPITITAVPQAGYRFSHWEGSDENEPFLTLNLGAGLELTPVFISD